VLFLSQRVSRVALLSPLSFHSGFSLLPWVISFALYFLHLPPYFKVHMKSKVCNSLSSRVLCHSLGSSYYRFSFDISLLVYCLCIFLFYFLFFSWISVSFSCFDIHFLVFLSVLVILSQFASISWLFTLSFHSCFSLPPLFCLVFPLTSFILLNI